jgi:hypothetical protein
MCIGNLVLCSSPAILRSWFHFLKKNKLDNHVNSNLMNSSGRRGFFDALACPQPAFDTLVRSLDNKGLLLRFVLMESPAF